MSRSGRRVAGALGALGLAAYGALAARGALGIRSVTGIDDADIFLVYGRNLARGHGWVYTPGYERVEGTTSFLWTLVHAGAWLVTDRPELVLLGVGVAVLAAGLYQLFRTGSALDRALRADGPGPLVPTPALLAVWVAAQTVFLTWSTVTLMDTALWTGGILWLTAVLARDLASGPMPGDPDVPAAVPGDVPADVAGGRLPRARLLAGCAAAALLVLTRPEALALVPGALALAAAARGGGVAAGLRRYGPLLGAWAGTAAALTGFRLAYFGAPVPNTYYAKVSGDRIGNARAGIEYVGDWISETPLAGALLVMALAAFLLVLRREPWRAAPERPAPGRAGRVAFLVSGVCLLGFLLPLVGGGDHFFGHRFLQPFVPLLPLPAAYLLARAATLRPLTSGARTRIGWTLAAGLALAAAWGARERWARMGRVGGLTVEFTVAWEGREKGELLAEAFPGPERPAVGVFTAGGTALTYPGRVLDLLGLNWTRMAHAPGPRAGRRGHQAFQLDVLLDAAPELVSPHLLSGDAAGRPGGRGDPPGAGRPSISRDECLGHVNYDRQYLKGLPDEPRFRERYRPALIPVRGAVVQLYARRDWLASEQADPVLSAPWPGLCDPGAHGPTPPGTGAVGQGAAPS